MLLLALPLVEVLLGAGLLVLRRRIAGEAMNRVLVTVMAVTVAALLIGTAVPVSGVALSVPVVAGMAFVLVRSRWRPGDLALLVLVAAAGTALAYDLVATVDPDTGSYGDQGAVGLAVLAVPFGIAATISARRRTRAQAPR